MRFATFSTSNSEPRVGLVLDDAVIDVSEILPNYITGADSNLDMLRLIQQADTYLPILQEIQRMGPSYRGGARHHLVDVRLHAPIPIPPKNVMCLGRNYPEHAGESARAFDDAVPPEARPDFPTVFTKAHTALVGPYDVIVVDPAVSTDMDWEVELAVVIGPSGANIPVDRALEHVFGYTVFNDVTARDMQRRYGGQFFKGKSLDASSPFGPWIVTPDELGPLEDLMLTLKVNDDLKQSDRVSSMYFGVAEIVAALSVGLTLEPGDVIATGTPGGVGFAREPKEFLRPGDVVEAEISRIGVLRNRVSGPR